jgi:tRNA dimethylallyltransferase
MAEHLIVIAGPTASGKTNIAIQVAQQIGAEIISADSRQLYAELNIGVARPTDAELKAVKHHLIATHSIFKPLTAAQYAEEATEIALKLPQKYAVVVGGTGLYINALLNGLDDIPPVEQSVRDYWSNVCANEGFEKLYQEIKDKDPVFFNTGEMSNPQRVQRALEVLTQTGKSITEFWSATKRAPAFKYSAYCLHPMREKLYENIEKRVDEMLKAGLWEEAEKLFKFRHLPVLHTIGYKEIFDALQGTISREDAINKIKQHTRNYAKRQITWFKNKMEMIMIAPEDAVEIIIKNTKAV